jgi:hypothetical protein
LPTSDCTPLVEGIGAAASCQRRRGAGKAFPTAPRLLAAWALLGVLTAGPVLSQRIEPAGAQPGAPFLPADNGMPALACDSAGHAIEVWSGEEGVFSRLRADGPEADGIKVSVTAAFFHGPPAATALASTSGDTAGGFFVVWENGTASGQGAILARRLDGRGLPQGEEIAVSQESAGPRSSPRVALDGAGTLWIAWQDHRADTVDPDIWARRFDGAGAPLGPEFLVNAGPAQRLGFQTGPVPVAHANGDVSVVWDTFVLTGLGGNEGLHAQRFDAAGRPLGEPVSLHAGTSLGLSAEVSRDGAGRLLLRWTTLGPDDAAVPRARLFEDATWQPLGEPFDLDTTAYLPRSPATLPATPGEIAAGLPAGDL